MAGRVQFFWSAALLALSAVPASAASRAAAPAPAALAPLPVPEIAYTRTVLANGLTLIVHEDHKAPVVAVNLWYHVGSKDEPPGRTGFAHLFEHLMFGATGGSQRGWFERLEAVGATDINGTTANDRTNFFETVPTSALDMTLAMEAQRMGHLLDSFSEPLLTTQRGVVQNEKRQDENQPYAVSDEIITKSVWPASHPYSHTVIGEMTDLDAARVADVKDWFSKYYGPANATLVLSGDVTPAEARAKAETYFGAIPPGPPTRHQKIWVARRTGIQRASVQDHVAQGRVYIEWNTPEFGSEDADLLDLLARVLGSGKDSRLYRRLVYVDQVATDISVSTDTREIGGLFDVELTAKPGVPLSRLETAFHEELERLLRDGPSAAELDRHRTEILAAFIRSTERVGGFGGTSDILAQYQTYTGDPGAWRASLERVRSASAGEVAAAGRRWLSDGAFVLEITPFPAFAARGGASAGELPVAGTPAAPKFPPYETATLANGLKLVVAERHDTPVVAVSLSVNAGDATDPDGLRGVASLDALTMLDGTARLDALAFDDRKLALGVELQAATGLDTAGVIMDAPSARLVPAVDLLADVVLHPAFRASDLARERALRIAALQQIKQDPVNAALRLTYPLSYGAAHPYGRLSTEAGLARIGEEDLRRHHAAWFNPRGATLVIVGDTTLRAALPAVQAAFGSWSPGPAPAAEVPAPAPAPGQVVYLLDKPGALQSVICATLAAPPKSDPQDLAIQAMITTLGGAFTSRLNMNLREDKHWAYGAFGFVEPARGPGLFLALAPVQTDKTAESFAEMQRELREIVSTRPITPRELELAQHNLTRSLPGRWETDHAVMQSLAEIARFDLPADYYGTYAQRVSALTGDAVERAATTVVRPSDLRWIIVGDKSVVTKPLEAMGLRIQVIDSDGAPLP